MLMDENNTEGKALVLNTYIRIYHNATYLYNKRITRKFNLSSFIFAKISFFREEKRFMRQYQEKK